MSFELPEDPNIAVSIINMKLRDYYDSLERLCDDLEIDCASLISTLENHHFHYDLTLNQFKSR